VQRDVPRGLSLLEKACDAGHLESCRSLGVLYERSPVVAPDQTRARALFQKACDGGNAAGCGNLAVQLESEGKDRALGLYRKACELGNVLGCFNGAQLLRRGGDDRGALPLVEKACRLGGNQPGVAMIAAMSCDDLARGHERADASPEERGEAERLRARALRLMHEDCEASGWACRTLAEMYEKGDRVPADPAKAAELWSRLAVAVEKECAAGIHQLCGELARLYAEGKGVAKDPERARKLREGTAAATRELCERGRDADSCYALGGMYERGEGVERSGAQAIAFFGRACQARHGAACNEEKRLRQSGGPR
jgi:TPR repeat protein